MTGGPSSDSPQAGTLRPRKGADQSGIRGATDTPPGPRTFDPPGTRASQGLWFTLWLSRAFQRTLASVHPAPTCVCTSEAQSPHVHPPHTVPVASGKAAHPGPCGLAPGQGCCLQRGDVLSMAWGTHDGRTEAPLLAGAGGGVGRGSGGSGDTGSDLQQGSAFLDLCPHMKGAQESPCHLPCRSPASLSASRPLLRAYWCPSEGSGEPTW